MRWAAKMGIKSKAGCLCLHDAAREKPTTSDEVLGEELGDDMLDAAHVDPAIPVIDLRRKSQDRR